MSNMCKTLPCAVEIISFSFSRKEHNQRIICAKTFNCKNYAVAGWNETFKYLFEISSTTFYDITITNIVSDIILTNVWK